MPGHGSSQQPQPVAHNMLRHARESRHEMTEAERRLWAQLRAHRLGRHFRRQHPIDNRFIVDFYCAEAKLCIEIDGDSHAEPDQAEYDAARTRALEARGLRVIRFTNHEVFHNLQSVLQAIERGCTEARRTL